MRKILRSGIAKVTVLIILVAMLGLFLASAILEEAQASKLNTRGGQIYDGTVSTMGGETHIYYWGTSTPTTPYARFFNRETAQLYDSTNSELGAKASVAWADSEVLLTDETTTVGGWLVNVPAEANMEDGWYDMQIYDRLTGTPLYTDTLFVGRMVYINNGILCSFDNR